MIDSKQPIVFFDGVCNLCNTSIQRILKQERKPIFKFAPLQWEEAQKIMSSKGLDPAKMDSILLLKNGKIYQKSRAIFRIAHTLKFPYPLLYIFWIIPYPIRDFFYDIIARNRYKWWGQKEACMLPQPEWKDRFLGNDD